MLKKHIVYLIIFFAQIGFVFAQNANVLKKDVRYMPFLNLWELTNNPVNISYHSCPNFTDASVQYGIVDGDYRKVIHPEKVNYVKVNTEGYTLLNKMSFYGKLNYLNQKEKGLNWNNVSFISPDNPFILADSIGGNYDIEQFNLQGGISSSLGEKFKWGVDVKYSVGSKTNQSDPRPKIISFRTSINSGIAFKQKDWEFGANISYEKFKEEIDIMVVDRLFNYRYFRFLGFGVYQGVTADYFDRLYWGWKYGGALQAKYKTDHLENLVEIKIRKEYERGQEGSKRTKYLTGDYEAFVLGISDHLILDKDNYLQKISLQTSIKSIKGFWFDQEEKIDEDNAYYWQVYNKSLKYKKYILNAELDYHIFKKRKNIIRSGFSGGLRLNIELADFYPENFKEDVYTITGKLGYLKNWSSAKLDISSSIKSGYRYNIKSKLNVFNVELQDKITYPEYYYKNSNFAFVDGDLRFELKKLMHAKLFPYISLNGTYFFVTDKTSPFYKDSRVTTNITMGFIF